MKLRGIIHGFESTNGGADEERLSLNIVFLRWRLQQVADTHSVFPIQVGSVATVIIGETQPEYVPAEDASVERKALEQLKRENASLRELASRLATELFTDNSSMDREMTALLGVVRKAGLL